MSGSTGGVLVIVNPRAGGVARFRARLEPGLEARGVEFELRATEGPGHAVELAEAAARAGSATVVAVGGDGTVHEVAEGLLRAVPEGSVGATALAVVPAGTGNDFVKQVPGLEDPRRALDAVAWGRLLHHDAGVVDWGTGREHFVNGAGTGIDVEVVRQIRRIRRLPGTLTYLLALVRALARFRPLAVRVTVDGTEASRRIMILAVGNGACIGGGFHVCPGARPDDGVLELCIVREVGAVGIVRTVGRVLRGTHAGSPGVELRSARDIRIESEGGDPLFLQLDGELREPGATSVHVTVRPGVLPVLAPPPQDA